MGLTDFLRHAFALPGPKQPKALLLGNSRTLGPMPALHGKPDDAIRGGLRAWRAKARYQCRFNPYAVQAKRTLQVNLIGPKGIRMIGAVPKRVQGGSVRDREKDEIKNTILERKWRNFCRKERFDLAGRRSFHQFELAITGSLGPDGGCMVRAVRRPSKPGVVGLKFELLSMQQLDDDYNGAPTAPGRFWWLGIEYESATGRATNYAILLNSEDSTKKHLIVPASEIRHIFIPEEIGQTREVPWLLPALTTIHQLGEYENAHWVKKRNAANTLGFVRRGVSETADGSVIPGLAAEEEPGTQELISRSSPGQWIELLPGEDIVPPQFGPDDGQYPEILRTMLRRFAAALSLSYATISRDFTDMNWATLRQAVLEDRDHYRSVQSILVQEFHQWVYELWLDEAVTCGELPIRVFGDYLRDPEPYLTPTWQPRSWQWVDPLKEIKALREAQEANIETLAGQVAETTGEDLETTLVQRAYEINLMRQLGILPPEKVNQPGYAEGDPPNPEA